MPEPGFYTAQLQQYLPACSRREVYEILLLMTTTQIENALAADPRNESLVAALLRSYKKLTGDDYLPAPKEQMVFDAG